MSVSGKKIFASAGISTSLDTVLATTLGNSYQNRLNNYKRSNNLLSEKSLSNDSSKSSSGSSLTLTNNNNNNINNNNNNNHISREISNNNNNSPNSFNPFPHHQFYSSQISTSANNWNNSLRSCSISSQKVTNPY